MTRVMHSSTLFCTPAPTFIPRYDWLFAWTKGMAGISFKLILQGAEKHVIGPCLQWICLVHWPCKYEYSTWNYIESEEIMYVNLLLSVSPSGQGKGTTSTFLACSQSSGGTDLMRGPSRLAGCFGRRGHIGLSNGLHWRGPHIITYAKERGRRHRSRRGHLECSKSEAVVRSTF